MLDHKYKSNFCFKANEYGEHEERFEPRESISSRGGAGRRDQERFTGYNRPTNIVRKDNDTHVNYDQFRSGEESFDPHNRSSSVITEIVENKIVYLDSEKDLAEDNEIEKFEKSDKKERDKQIQEYLNIDKNEYINKEEYEENSQDREQDDEIRNIKNSEEYQLYERRKTVLLGEKQELEDLSDAIDRDIDESVPVLEAANKATYCITKSDIQEIKSFSNPNNKIKAVIQSLMILLERPTDWASIKKTTADPNFMNLLTDLDRDNISEETTENLSDFIDENNLTDIESIKSSSLAASNLALFVVNVREYSRVMETVRPRLNHKKEVELLLAKKIVEIQKIDEKQQEMLRKGIEKINNDVRHAGLQTTFNGNKHIVHYEMEDDNGRFNVIDKELSFDPQYGEEIKAKGPSELGNYLYSQSNQNYGSNPNVEQNSLFFLSNLISKNDQSK